jgi:hypothetical protein
MVLCVERLEGQPGEVGQRQTKDARRILAETVQERPGVAEGQDAAGDGKCVSLFTRVVREAIGERGRSGDTDS